MHIDSVTFKPRSTPSCVFFKLSPFRYHLKQFETNNYCTIGGRKILRLFIILPSFSAYCLYYVFDPDFYKNEVVEL